eukprot:scaffold12489_cov145-Isochrysis_galbana.AAC.3
MDAAGVGRCSAVFGPYGTVGSVRANLRWAIGSIRANARAIILCTAVPLTTVRSYLVGLLGAQQNSARTLCRLECKRLGLPSRWATGPGRAHRCPAVLFAIAGGSQSRCRMRSRKNF